MKLIKKLLRQESTPGVILILTGMLAMLLSNSQFAGTYFLLVNAKSPVNTHFLINDILMTVFFLDVGLEIKHQVLIGHLSKLRQMLLPIFAAIGGVLVPAIIYVSFNYTDSVALHGWAIPTATDIAFAVGVIILLGKRIPLELKVLLLAIAIIDDLMAILIIALFYTQHVSALFLFFTVVAILALCLLNYFKVKSIVHYLMVGAILWYCMLNSGIHATISGVILALTIPLSVKGGLHKQLSVWVSFLILPLFAFTNAGISLQNLTFISILEPVPLGIALGLCLGKQLGIFSFAWLAVKSKLAVLPRSISWSQLYGMAIICGIGFTMSIFIGNLAFGTSSPEYLLSNKLGVLIGSTVSAVLGYLYLRFRVFLR